MGTFIDLKVLVVVFLLSIQTVISDINPPRTRLRSTAFGIPGQDAVYDYVGTITHFSLLLHKKKSPSLTNQHSHWRWNGRYQLSGPAGPECLVNGSHH